MHFFGKWMARFRLAQARAAELRGDYPAALTNYQEAVKRIPAQSEHARRASILNNMGMLCYAMNDMASSRGYYEQALALTPNDAGVIMNLANALDRLGDVAAAEEAYRRACQATDDAPEVLYNYAAFLAEREPAHATKLLRTSIDALVERSRTNTSRIEFPASFSGQLPLDLPLALLGRISERHALVGQTSGYFEELEARAPENQKLIIANELALMLTRAGRHMDAAAIYRRILDASPDLTQVRFNLGMSLVRSNRLDEALAEFRALTIAEARYGIGFVQEQRGEVAHAVREYTAYLERARAAKPDPLRAPGVDYTESMVKHARDFIAENNKCV
jgi:tetratricopeptide (TPR) repeat protein